MLPMELLKQEAASYGIELSEKQLSDFALYSDLMIAWNEKVNLTAIVDPSEIAIKHFLDSILLLQAVDIKENTALIDVGTGAGFPAVPIKILRRDLKITLLDSLNKRVKFLEELSASLGQQNTCIHFRAEEAGKNLLYREKFDYATARAVADLSVLAEYCLPFVKVGGYFVALKVFDCEEEVSRAKTAIALLGGEVEAIKKFTLYGDNKRAMILIKKISQTPSKYPRIAGKITKSPL